MGSQKTRPLEVLLVEDSPADARLTSESLKKAPGPISNSLIESGKDALRFLNRETPFETAPRPDLILLDLNLPGLDGRDVLRYMKSNSRLGRIPTIILTSSEARSDVETAYDLGANCYLTKPLHLDEYEELISLVGSFWLKAAELPPRTN